MDLIQSIDDIRFLQASVRKKRKGVITNFYLDEFKHSIWIQKSILHFEWVNDTLFFIKRSDTFWNVFYTSTNIQDFSRDLEVFKALHDYNLLIFDIVGKDIQCAPLLQVFKEQGFDCKTSLVRMNRATIVMDYEKDNTISRANSRQDVEAISKLLHTYFDEKTEQIPFIEELTEYAKMGHILVCREDERISGFLIYEMNATTLYFRYWFTHPDFRNKKINSRLFHKSLIDGKYTKRQLLWVIQSNENAIKRHKHFGFIDEDMYDYVMINNYLI